MLYPHILLLTLLLYTTTAIPLSSKGSSIDQPKSSGWSKEAIFGLVALLTAIGCFVLGLAWPRLREWLSSLPGTTFVILLNWRLADSLIQNVAVS
jgi:hypothetical protein